MAISRTSLRKDGFILSSLVTKDFKIKYRRSVLGVAWSVLNPLLQMIVLSAVFSFMFKFEIENFPFYLILGQTLFNLMSNSTSKGLTSIIDAAPLIKKIRVNKFVFPLEKVIFELVNFALSLIAVAAVMVYFRVVPTVNILFLPLLLVYVVLFCAGLSLLLAALAVFFRDVVHLWSVVALMWMYATPLFYPLSALEGWMQTVMQFNPMYQFVNYFREIVLWGTAPSLLSNLICFGMALFTCVAGYLVFSKTQKKFILYV